MTYQGAHKKINIFSLFAVALIAVGGITNYTLLIETIAALLIILVFINNCKPILAKINKNQLFLLFCSILFIALFWLLSAPLPKYNGESTIWPAYWWERLAFDTLLAVLVGFLISDSKHAITSIGIFCTVPTVMITGAVIYSVVHGLSLYVTTYSPYLDGRVSNAGLCNQLLYLPAFLFFYVFSSKEKQTNSNLLSLLILYIFVSIECFLLQKRVAFIVLYFLVPLSVIVVKVREKKISFKHVIASAALLLIGATGFVIIATKMARPINVFNDPRIHLHWSFLKQLLSHPLINASLEMHHQIDYGNIWWFHNFFADVHRSSGIIPFVISIILIGFIGLRIIYHVFYKTGSIILFFMFLFVMLLLSSSVVPEGEFHPLLLVLLLGSINESLLAGIVSPTLQKSEHVSGNA